MALTGFLLPIIGIGNARLHAVELFAVETVGVTEFVAIAKKPSCLFDGGGCFGIGDEE